MYSTAQNASAGNRQRNFLPNGQASHYGLRLYRDEEIRQVGMEDTRRRWNILVFLSEVYAPDMGQKDSGLYIAPVFDFIDIIGLGERFKGYLLSIPFDTWKLFDIHNLDLLFGSSSFTPYVALDMNEARALGQMMDILGSALESNGDPFS